MLLRRCPSHVLIGALPPPWKRVETVAASSCVNPMLLASGPHATTGQAYAPFTNAYPPRASTPCCQVFSTGARFHPQLQLRHKHSHSPGAGIREQQWRRWSPASQAQPLKRTSSSNSSGLAITIGDDGRCRSSTSSSHRTAAAARSFGHPSSREYDAVVVGLGAYGSAVLYHLAKAGLKVLGVERHRPVGHSLASSHGASRIIRLAYFEGLQYGPLLKRSYQLFLELQTELEAEQGSLPEPLFLRTGMLDVGSVFERALQSARVHGLPHEVLSGPELNRRFPAYRVPEHWQALFQPDGGVLAPERIVQAHVSMARRLGADVLTGATVSSWRVEGDSPGSAVVLNLQPTVTPTASPSVQPTTPVNGASTAASSTGSRQEAEGADTLLSQEVVVSADSAVLTPGPWIGQMVPELQELCVPERQVVGWFDIEAKARPHFAPDRFPVFVIEETPGGAAYYGFPEHGQLPGFKIGLYRHLREELRNPAAVDAVRRTADAADEAALRAGVASYFPAAARGRMRAASACFFTNTPDGHFLIDRHPRHPQVIICSACSGHGFKMSSGIGQLIARMVAAGPARAEGRGAARAAGGDAGGGWDELLPFAFDPVGRPGHKEAMARFG